MLKFRPLLVPTLMVVPALALLIGLGVWQVQRLHWKLALIEAVQTRMAASPVSLKDVLHLPPDEAEWRRVRVSGRLLNDKEAYLFASNAGGLGVHVLTPLVRDEGGTVLVDRGFVPDAMRGPNLRPFSQPQGEVTITGIFRVSTVPNLFTPAPDLKTRLWFSKDVPAIAAALEVRLAAPIVIEADATSNPGGYPIGGQTIVDFPNNHLSYAITWFGLALALVAVYLLYHVRQGRLGRGS